MLHLKFEQMNTRSHIIIMLQMHSYHVLAAVFYNFTGVFRTTHCLSMKGLF